MSVREWTTARRLIAICVVGMVALASMTVAIGVTMMSRAESESVGIARRWSGALADEIAVELNARLAGLGSVLASHEPQATAMDSAADARRLLLGILDADPAIESVSLDHDRPDGSLDLTASRDLSSTISPRSDRNTADGSFETGSAGPHGVTWSPLGITQRSANRVRGSIRFSSTRNVPIELSITVRMDEVTSERQINRTPRTSVFLLNPADRARVNGAFPGLSLNAPALGPWKVATGGNSLARSWDRARVRDDLVVSQERFLAADRPVGFGETEIATVLVLVPLQDLADVESASRAHWAFLVAGCLSALWGFGSIILLGVHGAWPSALTVSDEDERDDFSALEAHEGDGASLDWAVVSVRISATQGGGLSLDGSEDEHSMLLDQLASIAESNDMQVVGRMPDRLLAAEVMGHRDVPAGEAAAAFAIGARNVLAESVLARPMAVTVGIAGGSIGERGDPESWGSGAIKAAEALSETRQAGEILVSGRMAEQLRSTFVLEGRGQFWIDGVGSGDVWHLRGKR